MASETTWSQTDASAPRGVCCEGRDTPAERERPQSNDRALILVVDDDHWIRSCIEELLCDEGYAVATAADGQAALQVLEQMARSGRGAPDLILLDMRMPRMDGWAFARAYRERQVEHAPIVVISAAADAAESAAEVGAHGALAKPFEADEVLALVNAFVRQLAGYGD